MISFASLWEEVERYQSESSPLMDSGEESKGMQAIRAGLNLRGDNDPSFWHDFINLCANASGLASLLGVREEDVATWSSKIQKALHDVERHNKQGPKKPEDENQKMIPTGDNGAIVFPNQTKGA